MGCSSSKELKVLKVLDYKSKELKVLDNKSKELTVIEALDNKYVCKYNESEIIAQLNDFIKKIEIQDSFFEINDSLEDNIYDLLKKEEKKQLTDYFNKNSQTFINNILKFLSNDIKNYYYVSLSSEIINKNKKVYENEKKNKIKNEINKIIKDKESFKIKNLTVMLVGISGVGKSTLINNVLKIKEAITGTGSFQTTKIKAYYNKDLPYLRLIDTRGIELNIKYGAKAIMKDAQNYIKEQLSTDDINNFVHCIWYCITGNRFQQAEIDLLNALKYTYPDNKIPIIIVYTQATDENMITDMKKYIKEININEKFIKVLAERKKLINNNYLEAFGLDELLNETFKKCKSAIKGDMHSVMTNNISQHIKNILTEENSSIKKYITEQVILFFIKDYKNVKNDDEFKKYIIDIYESNIKYFFNIDISDNSSNNIDIENIIKDSIFINHCNNFINYYKKQTNNIINPDLMEFSIKFLDFQVIKEKDNNININIKNKRCLNDFVNSTSNFLYNNFFYLAQKYYIKCAIQFYLNKLSNSFEDNLNEILNNLLNQDYSQNLISDCFLKKFEEFEVYESKFNSNPHN